LDQGFDDPHYWNLLLENNNKILREDIKMKNGHILKFATEYQKLIKPNVQHIKKIEINKNKKTVRVPCLKEAECLQLKAGDYVDYYSIQVKGSILKAVVVDNFVEKRRLCIHEVGLCNYLTQHVSPIAAFVTYSIFDGRQLLLKANSVEDEVSKYYLTCDEVEKFKVNDEIFHKDTNLNNWELCEILEKNECQIKISYKHWGHLYDTWINIVDSCNKKRLASPIAIQAYEAPL